LHTDDGGGWFIVHDERWASEDDAHADDIPVAELSDEEDVPRARRRSTAPRSRRVAALSLAVSLLTAAAVTASRLSFDTNSTRRHVVPGAVVPGAVDTGLPPTTRAPAAASP
jgi:hypothetical protein